jgi:conjugative relaxase-like TrwC/TraI family protein
MLRIFQTRSVEAARSYYASGLLDGDYYSQEGRGIWNGRAAAMFGLSGEVEQNAFNALCENRHPFTAGKINPREDADRKVGYDMTFSAPKSVSILYEVLGDERILATFHASVRETMNLIEQDAHVRVRRGGMVSRRRTGNLIWAEFTHHTSRPVDGLSDPSLHCHCYCFNTSFDGEENRFKSGEFFHIKRDAPYYEAIFHSKLAVGLRQLGYGIEGKRFGFEVMGIGNGNIRRFSRRADEIEKMAELLGISGNDKAKDKLAAVTRTSKANALEGDDMREEWRERIDRKELTYPEHFGKCSGIGATAAVQLAIEGGLERQSVIQHRRLLTHALKFSLGSCSVEEIHAGIASRMDLISHEKDETLYTTTEAVLREEREILRSLKNTRHQESPVAATGQCDLAGLDADQRGAIRAIMNCTDRVIVVEGKAGTGKTSMMKAAVSAMGEAGKLVFTFAPTSQASHEVLREEGFLNAETIQRLLVDEKLQQSVTGAVLWVDEAGLLSVREMNHLFQIAEEQDARVVLSGDRFQHHSVQRGDALRLVAESGLVEVKQTRTIYRQRKELYREAVQAISQGRIDHGFGLLDQLGSIRESADFEEHLQQVAADYVESLARHSSVLVVSPTHVEGRMVTERIRERLKLAGNLAAEESTMPVHRNRSLTAAERAMPSFFEIGDIVRFHQNSKGGFRKGDVYQIRWIEGRDVVIARVGHDETRLLNLDATAHFGVFRCDQIAVAVGDKLRLLQNSASIDGSRLHNGTVYQVTAIQGETMVLNGRHCVRRDSGLFDHGYVSTSHSSQGKTADKVIISQSTASLRASSLEQFYVSASRGRDGISIWTDSKAELLEAVMKSDQRMLATEFALDGLPQKSLREEELIIDRVEEIELVGCCEQGGR